MAITRYLSYATTFARQIYRRRHWFLDMITPMKMANLALAGSEYVAHRQVLHSVPIVVKVDISPLCNLHCTVCVHAHAGPASSETLRTQHFDSGQMMTPQQYEEILREIRGRAMAVSLYYLGDPIVHPQLEEFCELTARHGLASHVNTNLSRQLSDDRIKGLVESGLTHLTVCVDGATQEQYSKTRVGGRLDLVLENLRRIIGHRNSLGFTYPRVEVQYIKFQHNAHEEAEAHNLLADLGVDQFTSFWGSLHNYTDIEPGRYKTFGPREPTFLPMCAWPYFAMQIRYDGDVVPCCFHRLGYQYSSAHGKDVRRPIGNVFRDGVMGVWNSNGYQKIRRLVAKPSRWLVEEHVRGTFCDDCPVIFETNADELRRPSTKFRWEQLYDLNERGIPVRVRE